MMRQVRELAPAKVNLALHVLGRRADGYHELDSLVAFVPQVADELQLRPAPRLRLSATGPFATVVPTDERNLALRAAGKMLRAWPDRFAPVAISLHKNLPVAAGIGGGSANAAAVMRGMCRLFDWTPPPAALSELALSLGADVPVCLLADRPGGLLRMRGVGEEIEPLPGRLPEAFILMVNPGVKLSTAEVFSRLRAGSVDPARALPQDIGEARWPDAPALAAMLARLRNDLQPPAGELAEEVAACLRELRGLPEVLLARMSGSGATCFAIFASRAAALDASRLLRDARPRWWQALGLLRGANSEKDANE